MTQWLRNPNSQTNDAGYAVGALIGGAIGNNQRLIDLKRTAADAEAYKANATNGIVNEQDKVDALNQLLAGSGVSSDVVGQKTDALILKNKQTWEGLEQQKNGLDDKGQAAITAQQKKIEAQSDYLRSMFPSLNGSYRKDASAADALAASKQQSFMQQQPVTTQQQQLANTVLPTSGVQAPTSADIGVPQAAQPNITQLALARQTSNPDYTLTVDRLVQQLGGNQSVDDRAAALAKAKASAGFDPASYTNNLKLQLLKNGHASANVEEVMQGQDAWAKQQYNQANVQPLQLAMQKAIAGGDMQTAYALASRIDQLNGGKQMTSLLSGATPNYEVNTTDQGNQKTVTMYNTKTGQGQSVAMPVGYKPDTVLTTQTQKEIATNHDNTSMRNTDVNNAGQNWRAQLSTNTQKELQQVKDKNGADGNGKLSLSAANDISDAYLTFERSRQDAKDTRVNPYAVYLPQAMETLYAAMGGQGQTKSNKITDAEYDALYNKLVAGGFNGAKPMTSAEAQAYIQNKYWK
ncbi:MAG: hypothetical protein H6Q65_565 [Firmicutes bacterium]|nr:hypothetical protein [Bacillota bacterium]